MIKNNIIIVTGNYLNKFGFLDCMKIVSVVGTRPNFIKLAALIPEIKKNKIEHVVIHTGQHYDTRMSHFFFEDLEMPEADEHLVIQTNLKGDEQKKFLKTTIKVALERQKPDLVIVVGDVNSTVSGAEAAHELGIKVAHVEAGLRSFDNTMPEEINRIETDKISDFLFTTEESGNENLKKEGINEDKIHFVGNVMIDTLLKHKEKSKKSDILKRHLLKEKNYCVLTLHRPSNVDKKEDFENILKILDKIQERTKIIFPIHPRTWKNIELFNQNDRIKNMKNLEMIDPLGYLDFLCLIMNSKFVLTDSGGIQEETTVLGIPCITLRKNTERPVTVEQGTNLLVSIDKEKVVGKAMEIIDNKIDIKNRIPDFWDGKVAERIVKVLVENI